MKKSTQKQRKRKIRREIRETNGKLFLVSRDAHMRMLFDSHLLIRENDRQWQTDFES